jgi:vacuolar-type H+-ATPase subunit E/Vma4
MAETIESFVARLREEGVQAGRREAEKQLAEARREADAILADARARAAKIVGEAQAQAEATLARSRTDLELAARDVALRLREALGRAVGACVAAGARQQLSDPRFLGNLLYELVMQYAQADIEGKTTIRINVSPETRQKLAEWALEILHKPELHRVTVDLQGTLADAGFEYSVDGASVEVTVASVVEALSELVNPSLREILRRAMREDRP